MKLLIWQAPQRAWRNLLFGLVALLAAGVVGFAQRQGSPLPETPVRVVVGLLLLGSWVTVVRFILMESWIRRFWLTVFVAALLFVVLLDTPGLIVGCLFSAAALIMRRYRCWRQVSDRKRAAGFGLGILALAVLFYLSGIRETPDEPAPVRVIHQLGSWSLISAMMFWAFSLFHLAIRMRLHFLRLRPKLGVSAFLIGVVPLLLVVLLGLMVLYTGLGGARAARTVAILESWRAMAAGGADLSGAVFDTTFVWPQDPAVEAPAHIPAPAWSEVLAKRLLTSRPARPDTTGWFLASQRLWLMRWRGLDTEQPRVQAWQVGARPLGVLSDMIKTGIEISPTGASRSRGEFVIESASDDLQQAFPGLKASYRSDDGDDAFWGKWMYFGGTIFEVINVDGEKLDSANLFINLRVGAPDLKADFLEGDSNLNIAVAGALAIVAFLFLVLEIFAIFFGVRITEGIVAGVHALHRGTRAVADGDLDTVITIPNEDEFGDLARDFNEMTKAVKHGREIALANDRLLQELATARSIQLRLLPSGEPRLTHFEVTGASIPSREVGGDYYDFLAQGDDRIGIAIGDVSGKGMPAALLMSNLQASLHGQVLHPGTVAGVVQRVNDLLVRSTDPHMFATFFYGVLDASTGQFICTNAGHNPPLVVRTDGRIEHLTTGGLLLGMLGDQVYQQDTLVLEPGEVVVLYTDGITEAVGPSAEEDDPEAMFGDEALHAVLKQNRHLPADAIKGAILAAVADHTQGVPQSDDITLVVIRRQN